MEHYDFCEKLKEFESEITERQRIFSRGEKTEMDESEVRIKELRDALRKAHYDMRQQVARQDDEITHLNGRLHTFHRLTENCGLGFTKND